MISGSTARDPLRGISACPPSGIESIGGKEYIPVLLIEDTVGVAGLELLSLVDPFEWLSVGVLAIAIFNTLLWQSGRLCVRTRLTLDAMMNKRTRLGGKYEFA